MTLRKTKPGSAVIVGAGVGGLSLACLLARAGIAVTVLEKNGTLGGRCGVLRSGNHRFDTGASMFLMRDVFEDVFRLLGERVEDHLKLERVDPTCRLLFDDGEQLDLTADQAAMERQLERLEPGSYAAFLRCLAEGADAYRISIPHFIKRNFDSFLDVCTPAALARLVRLRALRSHAGRVARYFKHPHLHAMLTYQDMYVGIDPYRAPAIYSLFPYMEVVGGLWYPRGGMAEIPAALGRIAQRLGVEVVLNAPARRIVVEGDLAKGVELADGARVEGDVVVANADLPYTYRELLPDPRPSRRLQRKQYACSAVTMYWGLDRPCEQLATQHSVFVASDYRAGFKAPFDPTASPKEMHFYVNAAARSDPSAAPGGGESLQIIVPVANVHPQGGQDFEAARERARAYVVSRFERLGIRDLAQHLTCDVTFTPESWRTHLNLERGAVFGSLAHGLTQVACFRPDNRHARYRNMFFVGGSTRPGSGVPMVLISSLLTAQRIRGPQT